jgi:hypothetical protein
MGWGVVMAVKSLNGQSVQRYSIAIRRSLITMVARRALDRVNGSASLHVVRPFVVMAARALGPGPTRLKLVKLAHNLGGSRELPPEPVELTPYVEDHGAFSQPTQRAA